MAYKVVRSEASIHDLALIFDHLVESYSSFGDAVPEAFDRATSRIRSIEDEMELLNLVPHQGTLLQHLLPGLRHVTKNKAVFYFQVLDDLEEIRVLAVFFGGQNHRRLMLTRLIENDEGGQ